MNEYVNPNEGLKEVNHWVVKLRNSKPIVLGAGGAGDVISAYIFCEVLKDFFNVLECLPVGILWERWVLDPYPGPIPKSLVRNARVGNCVWVNRDSYVERPNYVFKPQASSISEVLSREIPTLTLEYGVEGCVKCLDELTGLGYGPVVVLDVGGDILAEGHEENLWSPLADAISLAAASYYDSITAVLAPGADGELTQDEVLKKVEKLLKLGGYIGILGLWNHHVKAYEEILDKTVTEASKAPYKVLKGVLGVERIRGGSREVTLNPITLVAFIFKTHEVLKLNKLAASITTTKSLAEVVKIAKQLNISTELDIELTIAKLYGVGPHVKPDWKLIKRLKTANTTYLTGGRSSGVG